jgi:YjbE family integral membrane protein
VDPILNPAYFLALGEILLINLVLGGENAAMVAATCRPVSWAAARLQGMIWGTLGAIFVRVIFSFYALTLLQLPWLKLIGAVLLMRVGIKMLAPDEEVRASCSTPRRVRHMIYTLLTVNAVMGVDHVIAMAAVADSIGHGHQQSLMIIGVVMSIPIIMVGSGLAMQWMERFSFVTTLGSMALGWVAGGMAISDPLLAPYTAGSTLIGLVSGLVGALLVLSLGKRRVQRQRLIPVVKDVPA